MISIRAIKLLEKVQRVMIKVRMILHSQDLMQLSLEIEFSGSIQDREDSKSDESYLGMQNKNTGWREPFKNDPSSKTSNTF